MERRDFLAASGGAVLASACKPLSTPDQVATSCGPVPSGRPDGVRTGGSRSIKIDGKYNVWVKQVGTGSIPVLTLHGGPGVPHFYFECMEDFLPQAGVKFWYYDQLGCGFSDQPADTSLWNIDRFREEVEQVRAALGLDKFILFGQSWGGMLAIEYALKYPQHLSGLVISNMTASIDSYVSYVGELRKALPADVRATLDKYESKGQYEAPEYQQIMLSQVYSRHVCRLDPWPEPVARAFSHLAAPVYNTIQGPNEFVVTGTMKGWDRWKDLPGLKMPTLLIVGRYDEMNPADIQKMGTLIPDSKVVICEKGSHLSMWDDQETYFAALIPWLKRIGTQTA
ncbi:MAG: proline iminopeptidase-family hydrolase [Gemmatimonadota bacterium]